VIVAWCKVWANGPILLTWRTATTPAWHELCADGRYCAVSRLLASAFLSACFE
jgi:hypothetical protein